MATYLVCGSAGDGSLELCAALRATGVAGVPRPYFVPADRTRRTGDADLAGFEASPFAQARGVHSFPEFLVTVLKEGRSTNGVFGASIEWSCFESFIEKVRTFIPYGGNATYRSLLRRSVGIPRFVHLVWRDRVRQAVAATVAETATPSFDPERIDGLVEDIEQAEAGWEALFDVLEVAPLRLVYEDWSEALPRTVEEILRWIEIPEEPSSFDPTSLALRVASPSLVEEWLARYASLRGGS